MRQTGDHQVEIRQVLVGPANPYANPLAMEVRGTEGKTVTTIARCIQCGMEGRRLQDFSATPSCEGSLWAV